MKSKRIGVLMGGMSAEKEVSMTSGEAIFKALSARGYDVVKVFVDHDLDRVLRQSPIDVAFIALHGSYGEDGCVQGLLEILRIPYTGPGVTESALCMDKLKSKELFRLYNASTPPYYAVRPADLDRLAEAHGNFGYPVFVKPRRQGSSVGAGKAADLNELTLRCEDGLRFDECLLVERFIAGRELAVGVLDGKAMGVIEIVPKSGSYDYKSKYSKGHTDYYFPARISAQEQAEVMALCEQAARAVDTPGAIRMDVLLSHGGNPYLLEVNTLPGMTPTSLLPKIAAGVGLDFGDLCEEILRRARLNVGVTARPQSEVPVEPKKVATDLPHSALE